MKRSILLAFVMALMLAVGVGATATADSGAQASAKKPAAKKKAAKCNTKPKAKGKAKGKARKSLASGAAKKKGKKKASKCKAKPKKKTAKPKAKPAPTVPTPAPPALLPGAGFGDGGYKDAATGVTINVNGQLVDVQFPLPGGGGCLGGPLVGGDSPLTRTGGKALANGIITGAILSLQWDLKVDEATLDYELATFQQTQVPPCQHGATFTGKLAKQ